MTTLAPPTEPPTAAASGQRRRWIALYVLCAGMLMIVLDVTVVNVALPSVQSDLHFSGASLAWVVNAYLISFGGLLLLADGAVVSRLAGARAHAPDRGGGGWGAGRRSRVRDRSLHRSGVGVARRHGGR